MLGPALGDLWAAFSLRRNWRSLTSAAPRRLGPVDGLRAIAVLWVILFHVGWFAGLSLAPAAFRNLVSRPALRLVFCGDLGVDVFFTISGFLIGRLLWEELATTGTVAVRRFYLRRAMRLLPAYLAVLWLYCQLGLPHRETVWANLIYVNNFLPLDRQCMVWSWSLAVEEQFYLVCPLLLLFAHALPARFTLPLLITLVVAAVAGSFWLVWSHGITLPILLSQALGPEQAARYFDVIYDKTQARCGALLIGVLAAYLKQPMELWLRRAPGWATAGLISAVGTIAVVCWFPARVPDLVGVPYGVQISYLAGFRYAVSAAVAYLILLSLADDPLAGPLRRFFSHRAWFPIAQLSYSAYLLHPLCILLSFKVKPPLAPFSNLALVGYMAIDLGLSFFTAAVLYLFVERPFINLRAGWLPLLPSGPRSE